MVEADGIRTISRPCAEDAFLRSGLVSPRMDVQNIAARSMQPGEDDNVVAGPNVPEALNHLRLEDQPGRRCAFVGLPRRAVEIRKRRFDPTEGFQFEVCHVRCGTCLASWNQRETAQRCSGHGMCFRGPGARAWRRRAGSSALLSAEMPPDLLAPEADCRPDPGTSRRNPMGIRGSRMTRTLFRATNACVIY